MTVVFRKNEILAVGGYQDHLFMEDYNLWLRLLAAGYELRNIKIYSSMPELEPIW